MSSGAPPAADDDDAYVFVDHREKEGSVIEQIASRLAPGHSLTAQVDEDDLLVTYRGKAHRFSLIIMPLPDGRYYGCIEIFSLAELLQDDYRIFVLTPWQRKATDRLLVVPVSEPLRWGSLPMHLTPLEEDSYVYFSRVTDPSRPESVPDSPTDSDAARVASEAMSRLISNAFFSGKVDTGACASLAELIMTNPELRDADFPESASKAEIAAQLENVVREALQDPEVKEGRSEFDDAMQALWKVTGGPPKKDWWNL